MLLENETIQKEILHTFNPYPFLKNRILKQDFAFADID